MVINISVRYDGGLLPDIVTTIGEPRNSILLLPCCMMYYSYVVSVLFLLFVWCPCMAINVSVHYNGGLLPDIILLTQCHYHCWGTRLNAMKRFCI